jgi:hypothetical protein
MTLTHVPRRACSSVMRWALSFLDLIPTIIELERRPRVCTLVHEVSERTDRAARGSYDAYLSPSQSERVPLPHLLARHPTSQAGILSSRALRGVIGHNVPRDTDIPDDT